MVNYPFWTGLAMSLAWLASPVFAADGEAPSPATTLPATAPAAPEGLLPIPDYGGDLWTRSYLTGDWDGVRTKLADKGVQLDVDWTQTFQSVVSGGRESGNGYDGNLNYLFHFDLMRMGLLPGALITVRAETRYGTSVNGIAGPILPVNTAGLFPLTETLDAPVPIAVTDLNYTQFLSEKFAVTLGKLDTLSGDPNEFASGRGVSQFMNANFIFNPAMALRLPYSTLGIGVLWMPTPTITVTSSLINTVDSSTTSGFNDFGQGYTWASEIDWQYRLHELPGGMNLGGLYSFAQDFSKFTGDLIFTPGEGLSISSKSSTWAIYWSGWQYLLIRDPTDKPINTGDGMADHEGIGVFARLGFADQDTNPVKWSGSIGIGDRGLIPTRKNDQYGVGYYYTRYQDNDFTNAVGIGHSAQGLEAYYNLAITPAAHLSFDVQYLEPALPKAEPAIVLGMRLHLEF
jgi:porin